MPGHCLFIYSFVFRVSTRFRKTTNDLLFFFFYLFFVVTPLCDADAKRPSPNGQTEARIPGMGVGGYSSCPRTVSE